MQPPQTASKVTSLADCVEALIAVSEQVRCSFFCLLFILLFASLLLLFSLLISPSLLRSVSKQGGGCPVEGAEELWPDVSNISSTTGVLGGGELYSHWARFASAAAGRAWAAGDNSTTGPRGAQLAPIGAVRNFTAHPTVSDYAPGSAARSLARDFATNYTSLLVQLHNVFNGAPSTYFATLAAMHTLTTNAGLLLTTPDPRASKSGPVLPGTVMGPPWEYVPSASQYAARSGKARPIVRN